MTYMWREEKGKPFYRFQTDEKEISDKMKRRQKFILSASGYNTPLWVFQTTFNRADIAKKVLKTLTGGKIEFDASEDIYLSESPNSNEQKRVA